ncbi:hypothetical protein MKW92_020946 [Papaver armeniacum]|nr:hypothetical protein MKW92_020946 [Papaver armeniacum]
MDSESVNLEERLKSFLIQLQNEFRILDRIVRRDVKLLLSAGLQEMLDFLFQIINEKNLQGRLKRRKCNTEKYNYQERLLGVARLLSQMVEPMVKAAICKKVMIIFCVDTYFLLHCRQILLDVVSVYNMISSISQKEHSVKLNRQGIEVIREYYPSNDEIVTLECIWEKDKFVLHEKVNKIEIKKRETDLQSSNIKYQTVEAFLGLGDDEPGYKKMDTYNSIEEHPDPINIHGGKVGESTEPPINITDEGSESNENSFDKSSDIDKDEVASPSPKSPKPQIESKRKAAFISIGKPKVPQTSESILLNRRVLMSCDLLNTVPTNNLFGSKTREEKDPFFSLLTGGTVKDSLLVKYVLFIRKYSVLPLLPILVKFIQFLKKAIWEKYF